MRIEPTFGLPFVTIRTPSVKVHTLTIRRTSIGDYSLHHNGPGMTEIVLFKSVTLATSIHGLALEACRLLESHGHTPVLIDESDSGVGTERMKHGIIAPKFFKHLKKYLREELTAT